MSADELNDLLEGFDINDIDMDLFKEFVEYASSLEKLDEGMISAVKGKLISMAISMMPDNIINNIINKSFTKAMSKATTPEQKQHMLDIRSELLALDKKAKKAKLKSLIKKAPQRDVAAAELKIRAEFKKNKLSESVIIKEDEKTVDQMKAERDALDQQIANANAGITNAEYDGLKGTVGEQGEKIGKLENENKDLSKNMKLFRVLAIILGSLLAAAIIYIIVLKAQNAYY